MPRKLDLGRYDFAAHFTFVAYAAASLAIPVVLVRMAAALGFPLDQGGMTAGGGLHLVRSLALCASMACCALVAARWGNRRPLGVSAILVGVGMLACALTPSYALVMPALVVAGLGEGTIEGLATPFVQKLHDDEPSRYVNFAHGFWSLGVLIATLLFGVLLNAGMSWRAVLAISALFALPPALLLLLPNRTRPYPERTEALPAAQVARQALAVMRVPRFWLYFGAMFLAGGGEFCLTFWCASFIQLDFAGSAMAGGLGTAAFSLGMFLGRTGCGVLVPHRQLRPMIVAFGILAAAVSLAIPFLAWSGGRLPGGARLAVLFGLLFLTGVGTAPFWPSIQSYAVDRMPRQDSTMVFILLSCAGIPGCGVFTLLMGALGDRFGLPVSFFLVPACFLVMTGLVLADRLSGRHAAR